MRLVDQARLCAGKGKYFSLTKPTDNPGALSYTTTSWPDILWMAANPTQEPKEAGWWVIPSDYIARDARQSRAQEEHGRYWLLVADLDQGNVPLASVCEAVRAALDPGTEFLIYATRSSLESDKRWRIMVPMGGACPGIYYHHFADTFNRFLTMRVEVGMDDCTNRVHQIAFLPNRGLHYEWHHQPGAAFGDAPDSTLSTQLVVAAIKALHANHNSRGGLSRAKDRGYYLTEFAKRYPVEDLLDRYGFEGDGKGNYHHPKIQTTRSYGTKVTDDGAWVTASQSVQSFLGRAGGDSFDLLVAFEYGGNRDRAYKDICNYITYGTNEPPQIEFPEYLMCGGKPVKIGVVL